MNCLSSDNACDEPRVLRVKSAARCYCFFSAALLLSVVAATAQPAVIESLSRNGILSWSNAAPGGLCRVEWAPSLSAQWSCSWDALADLPSTNGLTQQPVPMFYRVVSYPVPVPAITNVSAAQALALLQSHPADSNFMVLDVRMPSEYSGQHVRTALNVNFYSTAFEETLQKLDRKKTYLVYCASGNRSRQAVEAMRRLQFRTVYNQTEGFATFAAVPGAAAFVE